MILREIKCTNFFLENYFFFLESYETHADPSLNEIGAKLNFAAKNYGIKNTLEAKKLKINKCNTIFEANNSLIISPTPVKSTETRKQLIFVDYFFCQFFYTL